MKYNQSICLTLLVFALGFSVSVFADDTKARDIMQKVDDRDDGDQRFSDMDMTLIDKHLRKRERRISTFNKDFGEDSYRIMFFQEPNDVKNTAFLTYDYDLADKDDDQWLYLPALKKTKRIASTNKSGSFMGSDFSYSDMTTRDLDDYNFFMKKGMDVNKHKVWVIEAVPVNDKVIEETGYIKSLLFVRQDNYVVIRAIHWQKEGKRLKYFDIKKLELIDNIWTPLEMHMTSKKGSKMLHKTMITFSNVTYNQPMNDQLFTIRRLEKGL